MTNKDNNTMFNENEIENYYWVAVYNDGSYLMQYEKQDDGRYIRNSFYDIDQSKLDLFIIKNKTCNQQMFQLKFNPETMKLIWFWDRNINLSTNNIETTHCIGWQENHNGKQVKVIMRIKEDGTVILTRG